MKHNHTSILPRFFSGSRNAQAIHDLGITLAFGSVLFNGTYNAFAKGLTDFLSPISLLLLSEALTATFVLLTIGLFPLIGILSRIRGKEFMAAILVGALSSGIGPLLWFQGLSQTTAVNASLYHSSTIIFVLFFGYLLLKENINAMQCIGMTIVMMGIFVISMGQYGMGISVNPGDAFIILSTAVMALGTIIFKRHLQNLNSEAALFIRNISGIVTALMISSFFRNPFIHEIRNFPLEQVFLLLAFAFFSRFLNLTFFYAGLQRISATKAALIDHATPLASVFFAVLILHEEIFTYHILGAIFIVFGLILEQFSTERLANATRKILAFRTYHHHTP